MKQHRSFSQRIPYWAMRPCLALAASFEDDGVEEMLRTNTPTDEILDDLFNFVAEGDGNTVVFELYEVPHLFVLRGGTVTTITAYEEGQVRYIFYNPSVDRYGKLYHIITDPR